MPHPYVLSFVKDVELGEESVSECIVLRLSHEQLTFQNVGPELQEAAQLLFRSGATEQQLVHLVLKMGETTELGQLYCLLQILVDRCLLQYTVLSDGHPLATAMPISLDFRLRPTHTDPNQKYILSRFAYCRREQDQLVLESPLSFAQVLLHGWKGAALIAELANPRRCDEISAAIPGIAAEVVSTFISLLASVGMLTKIEENGKVQEDGNAILAQWEFHDLLFHAYSRSGRHANPTGETYRFLGQIEPLPAVKAVMSDRAISLYKPDIARLMEVDLPFTYVLEHRRSLREHGEKPITVHQLGELLYRSARVRRIIPTVKGELCSRPYPSGGALFELELYVVVNQCDNLTAGLYHYDPGMHQLCQIVERNAYVEAMLQAAGNATGKQLKPQVLIVVAARFQRLAWKYQSITYALILKHVGVLYQTMYLVATAMGLAPCALGSGDSDLFAKAAGTEYYAETSVGEFALGSLESGG